MGILAFLRAITEPAFNRNRERWEALKDKLAEQDLIDLQYEVYASRRIPTERISRINQLVEDIDQDAEYLRLGPPFRSRFSQHLREFSKSYKQLRVYIQNPYWKIVSYEDADGDTNFYEFNKKYFYEVVPNGYEVYVDHLNQASDVADDMRRHYRAVSVLADLHAFEAPVALFTYRKRSQVPRR